MLHNTSQVKRIKRNIKEVLDKREQEWYDQQKRLKKNKIEEFLERGKHRDNYIDKVLVKCKSWGGPFLCTDELKAVISGKSDDIDIGKRYCVTKQLSKNLPTKMIL